jgi:hypothetical protein
MPWYPRFLTKWEVAQPVPPQSVPNDSPNWHTLLPWTTIAGPGVAGVALWLENLGNGQLDDWELSYRPNANVQPGVGVKTGANIAGGATVPLQLGGGGGGGGVLGMIAPPGDYMVRARTASAPGTSARITIQTVAV